MKSEITVFAPAKINLFLEVTGKRENGYHDLATLFAKIAIGDSIKISAQKAPQTAIDIKVRGPYGNGLKGDKTNLVYKAAAAFFEHFKISAACQIRLEKNIPLASGLGGGSSDAAAVIMALCALFKIETNAKRMKELVAMAAKLGADVPFFLHEGTFCKGEGIGDILTPVKNNIVSPYIVIVYPNIESSTADAYKALKLNNPEKILTNASNLNRLIDSIEGGNPLEDWCSLIYNKLEDCVFERIRSVFKIKNGLLNSGADAVLMSGSGSCVFALVKDKDKADEIAKEISANGSNAVFVTHFWRTKL